MGMQIAYRTFDPVNLSDGVALAGTYILKVAVDAAKQFILANSPCVPDGVAIRLRIPRSRWLCQPNIPMGCR